MCQAVQLTLKLKPLQISQVSNDPLAVVAVILQASLRNLLLSGPGFADI